MGPLGKGKQQEAFGNLRCQIAALHPGFSSNPTRRLEDFARTLVSEHCVLVLGVTETRISPFMVSVCIAVPDFGTKPY